MKRTLLVLCISIGVLKASAQCTVYPSGVTGLMTTSIADTGVTFQWSSDTSGQNYSYMVTNDSSYTGYENTGFVYYANYTPGTSASQGLLQPSTRYWIFVQKTDCSALDSISFVTKPWDCSAHTLQPGIIPVAEPCSSFASFGMNNTSIYQQYTFLHNGKPIGGYTNLPGSPSNPVSYPVPSGQGAAGSYMVVSSFINCPGGPVDTGNTEYWYFAGIDSLAITALTGTSAQFRWSTLQDGSTYQWGVSTDSLTVPDSTYNSTDTVATATGLVPGTKYYLYVSNLTVTGCSNLFDTLSFVTPGCGATAAQLAVDTPASACTVGNWLNINNGNPAQTYTMYVNGVPDPLYSNVPGIQGSQQYAYYMGDSAVYYLVAYSTCGDSARSNSIANSPLGLSGLRMTYVGDTSMSASWVAAVPGQTYAYTITTDSTDTNLSLVEAQGTVADTLLTAGLLTPQTRYYLFVRDSACGASTEMVAFTTAAAVVRCPPGVVPVPSVVSSTGSYVACGNNGLLLTSSSGEGNVWYLNGAPLDSTGTTMTATQAGNYFVVVTNAAGCKDTSAVVTVTTDPGPPAPVLTASGSTEICAGGSVTLQSSASTGNQWYAGNLALPGATATDYVVSQAGGYWVQVTDTYGCWANSAIITVTVNTDTAGQSVVPTISPAGPVISCQDTAVLLVASQAVNYQWFWNGDAIPGENGDSLVATLAGSYTVATGTAGCGTVGALSAPVVLTYLDQLVPTITMANGVLVSSSPTGNQWYKNDSVIRGATHQEYTPQGPGSYSVKVGVGVQTVDTTTWQIGVGGCWSDPSAPFVISDTIYTVPQVVVYPNPLSAVMTLANQRSGPVTVRVFDLMGRQVMTMRGVTGTVLVDVGRWAKGAYFVQIIDEGTQLQEKVVVVKL